MQKGSDHGLCDHCWAHIPHPQGSGLELSSRMDVQESRHVRSALVVATVQHVRVGVQQKLGAPLAQLLGEQVPVERLCDAVNGDAAPRAVDRRQLLRRASKEVRRGHQMGCPIPAADRLTLAAGGSKRSSLGGVAMSSRLVHRLDMFMAQQNAHGRPAETAHEVLADRCEPPTKYAIDTIVIDHGPSGSFLVFAGHM